MKILYIIQLSLLGLHSIRDVLEQIRFLAIFHFKRLSTATSPPTNTREKKHKMVLSQLFHCSIILGLVLSVYAIYIDYKIQVEADYVPSCDLHQHVLCSKALSSEYSRMLLHSGLVSKNSILNQLNAVYGLLFYLVAFVFFRLSKHSSLARLGFFLLSLFALIVSGVLGFIMFNILQNLCLICVGTYITNITIFLISLLQFIQVDKKDRQH